MYLIFDSIASVWKDEKVQISLQKHMSIKVFENILLEDTFVFSWHRDADTLTFQVLVSLLQSHPEASLPAKDEWACYRCGVIRFSGVTSVHGLLPQDSVLPTTDADGSVDYGTVDALELVQSGEYCIVGEFGNVMVAAHDVALSLAAA